MLMSFVILLTNEGLNIISEWPGYLEKTTFLSQCFVNTFTSVQKMEDSIKAPNIFPLRVWKVVKIFLGIKTLKEDRPITSTILHVLTFSSALGD